MLIFALALLAAPYDLPMPFSMPRLVPWDVPQPQPLYASSGLFLEAPGKVLATYPIEPDQTPLMTVTPVIPNTRVYDAEIIDCYDGDTCTFNVHLRADHKGDYGLGIVGEPQPRVQLKHINQHVRLCDINAPELHPGPNKAAMKARDDLVGWIRKAKVVELHVPQGTHKEDKYEKYGRLLVYVVADGVNLNERQLKQGNAKPFIRCDNGSGKEKDTAP